MTAIETIETDVLVLGGGFAGSWAAYRAADFAGSVVLVDKAHVSRSGASAISGGVTTCPMDDDNLDLWAEEFISRGGYMCDQDWTRQLLEGQRDRVRDYIEWGVPISREADGRIRRFASRGMVDVRCMQYKPKVAIKELRRRMEAKKVRIVDRVCITELLTSDGQWPTQGSIIGAVGFHVHDGRLIVLKAKRTVLATGMISMKGTHGVDNDTGDGVAMAYRAGARLIDMEFTFGGTFSVLMKNMHFPSYNVAVAQGARLINARGERFMTAYDPVRLERSELPCVVAAFTREIMEGRGPVYVDLRHMNETYWNDILSLNRGNSVLASPHIPDPRRVPLLIEPSWGLWASGRAGLQIDLGCRSSLPGLFAAGSTAKNDATGTHASAGAPTAFCFVSGWTAGETAGRESREFDMPELDAGTLEDIAERTFAPLRRPPTASTPDLLARPAYGNGGVPRGRPGAARGQAAGDDRDDRGDNRRLRRNRRLRPARSRQAKRGAQRRRVRAPGLCECPGPDRKPRAVLPRGPSGNRRRELVLLARHPPRPGRHGVREAADPGPPRMAEAPRRAAAHRRRRRNHDRPCR